MCSASYETRKFGVRSAMPISRALRLCPEAMCVPVPGKACSRKHREIRAVLDRFAPVVESASIDEWYMDLAGTEALYHNEPLATTGRRIRDAVMEATNLSVSIGGGTSKLVAKLAVERAKPKPGTGATGVHIVAPGQEAEFLAPSLSQICRRRDQVRTTAKLGMKTVRDVFHRSGDPLPLARDRREGCTRRAWHRSLAVEASASEEHIARRDIRRRLRSDRSGRELLAIVTRAASGLRGVDSDSTITVRIRASISQPFGEPHPAARRHCGSSDSRRGEESAREAPLGSSRTRTPAWRGAVVARRRSGRRSADVVRGGGLRRRRNRPRPCTGAGGGQASGKVWGGWDCYG